MGLIKKYKRLRSAWWRRQSLLFPSTAERKFMKLMGAWLLTFNVQAHKGKLTIVLNRGKVLRQARMQREVWYGRYRVDWSNDLHWMIEVDGSQHDVVADFDREVYIREMLRRRKQDMRLMRIPAYRLWQQPSKVRAEVMRFLSS